MEEKEIIETDGFSKMKNLFINSIPQVIFIINLFIWLGVGIYLTMVDIFSGGFEHKALGISFILCTVSGGYLKVKHYINDKKNKPLEEKSDCKTCGKG